jgi:hypothetical protein
MEFDLRKDFQELSVVEVDVGTTLGVDQGHKEFLTVVSAY